MNISDKTLEIIEEESFFSDIPVDHLLNIFKRAYHEPTPANLSREEFALRRVKSFVKERELIPLSKTLSIVKRVLNG